MNSYQPEKNRYHSNNRNYVYALTGYAGKSGFYFPALSFKVIILMLTGLLLTASLYAQPKRQLQWIGGPTYVLQLGSFKVLTDPMLSPQSDTAFIIKKHPGTGALNAWIKRYIAPAAFDTAHTDVLLISHPHADHFDREAAAFLSKDLPVIVPPAGVATVQSRGFRQVKGLKQQDTITLKKGAETLQIIAVYAMHAEEEPLKTELGEVNGYIITHRYRNNVYRIYWTGDTVWFDDIQQYTRFGKPDLLIPDMGAVGTDGTLGRRGLNAEDCLKIIEALHPAKIIPVHHSTFSLYVEPVSHLQQLLDKTPYSRQLQVIPAGATVKL
ncbi:MBL fold metallo-hydrolase [Chitinophaga sp. Mgbs1]|uniref:MBL fold metallo-hydrolase n=1 Tax=Chitinophaga solisilvae TaxID=1233460 RepID=A0A433WPP7_9BACT|nr:MBL fold metallo-hydrolase [Chitinophaga solisilvae]